MLLSNLKLAWRNLFRNKRRSFIAGTAIGIGLAALIFTDALIIGMEDNMIRSATDSFLGEAQIHRDGFMNSRAIDQTVKRPEAVTRQLENESIVKNFTRRAQAMAMISSPANVRSINLVGIEPDSERPLSQIDEALQQGDFFEDSTGREILIGRELADILRVGLGDRVVVTVSQAHTNELSQELFRVSGIYFFNMKEMDRSMAFVRLDKAQAMLNIGDNFHEIAINFTDLQYSRNSEVPFWDEFSQHGNTAQSWTDLLPQLEIALQMSDFSTFLVGLLLFGVVALGIINTLFMSLYERMFEFGVLRAIGTRPFHIGQLIFFEAGALAIVSIVLGTIIGLVLTLVVAQTGIDYTGIQFAGVTFREMLYPVLKLNQFIVYPFWVFLLTLLVGLYPAHYAAKITPAEAMRKVL